MNYPFILIRHFTSKMGLLGNSKEVQFRICGLMVNHASPEKDRRGGSLMDVGGAVVKEGAIGGNGKFQARLLIA